MRDEDELVHMGEDEDVDETWLGNEQAGCCCGAEKVTEVLGLAGQNVLVLELIMNSK